MRRSIAAIVAVLVLASSWLSYAGEYTIFGPKRFERGSGPPAAETIPFASPVAGSGFKLKLVSGDKAGASRVSSGSVTLNGAQVAGPADFNQQVGSLERNVSLNPANTLSVQLASQPGSHLTVSLTGEDNDPPEISITSPVGGSTFQAASIDVQGTVVDTTPVAVSVNGIAATVEGESFSAPAVPLAYGENRLTTTATDLGGNTATSTITVTRSHPAPIVTLSVEPVQIQAGASALLNWSSTNADLVRIAPDIGAVAASGALTISPSETTTYVITAAGPGGTATAEALLSVEQPAAAPTAAISVKPDTVQPGESTLLSWSTTDADRISIEPGIGAAEPQGSIPIAPEATTTYTIIATGPGGSVISSATVTVSEPPSLPTVFISVKPMLILPGETAILSWGTTNADRVSIEPGIGTVEPRGSLMIAPEAATTYTITATGPGGQAVAEALLTVEQPAAPPTAFISARPAMINPGESVSLSWGATDADRVWIEPEIGTVAPYGSISVAPGVTTTYLLTASGPGGMAVSSFTVTVMESAALSMQGGSELKSLLLPGAGESLATGKTASGWSVGDDFSGQAQLIRENEADPPGGQATVLSGVPLPLFGPVKYQRTTGAPSSFTGTFQVCNPGAVYRLVAENGEDGQDRVSSAAITLNGVDILRPSDLNQQVERVERDIDASQGSNTLEVRLTSNPGGFLTVSLFCISGCADVVITSPTPGSTVNGARALVQGYIYGASGETGVRLISAGVEGEAAQLAQVQGDLFAGLVPLQGGENTITVIATDACGNQARREVTVHADSVQEAVRLSAWPASGILPAGGADFEVTLEAEVNLPSPAVHYAWDFDGGGIVDRSGNDLTNVAVRYSASGLYLPTVTVTDAHGRNYTEIVVIQVFSREEFDALLKGKWGSMKTSLAEGEIEQAVGNFAETSRDSFRQQFTVLFNVLPRIVSEMGEATLVEVRGDRAIYDLRTVRNGSVYSFQLEFICEGDGIWRIRSF